MLQVYLLGRFHLLAPHGEVVLPTVKVRLLAAYLFWRQGEWVRRDELRGMLWGEVDEQHAAGSLRTALKCLRQALKSGGLPDGVLETQQTVLRVIAGPSYWVDAKAFEEKARVGLQESAETGSLITAASLYHGDFLDGMDGDWCLAERRRLADLHIAVLRTLVDRLTASGLNQAAYSYARRWLTADPLDEAAHQALMRLYAAMGQPARVVEQFEHCRQVLKVELGIAPSETTERVYNEMGLSAARKKRSRAKKNVVRREPGNQSFDRFSEEPLLNARMLLYYGQAVAAQGDSAGGKAALVRAFDIYRKHGSDAEQSKARLVLGQTLLWLSTPLTSQADEALRYIGPALEYYRIFGPLADLGRSLALAAEACWLCRRNNEAIALAQEGLAVVSDLKDPELEAHLVLLLGLGLRQGGRLGEARVIFERAVRALPSLSNPRDVLWFLLQRGVLSCLTGELTSAERFLREVVTLSQMVPSPWPKVKVAEAMARSLLIIVLHYQDRYLELPNLVPPPEVREYNPEPLSYLNSLFLLPTNRRSILKDLEGWLRSSLYNLPPPMITYTIRIVVEQMLVAGMDREAARWATLGVRFARSRGWTGCAALFYCHRAVALARQGQVERAERCRRWAEEAADEADNWIPPWLARADGLIARMRGDSAAARKHLAQSRQLFLSIGDRYDARLVKSEMSLTGVSGAKTAEA
ncbi:MAG: BTAD domain-containing putative transcriptional regulator [Bacillota bacterium]